MTIGDASHSAPPMPASNPWLVDSGYPTSHFNPGATDSVLIAGPTVGRTLTRNRDVKAVTNVMVSNPTVKKINSDTVAFASGTLGILKLRLTGDALDAVAFTPYPGFEDIAKRSATEIGTFPVTTRQSADRDHHLGRALEHRPQTPCCPRPRRWSPRRRAQAGRRGVGAHTCVSTSVTGTEITAVASGAGSGCAAGQNTDRPLAVVNSSRAAIAATELPAASSRGPQAHRVPCWGITASTPPPTPLLAGSPTR